MQETEQEELERLRKQEILWKKIGKYEARKWEKWTDTLKGSTYAICDQTREFMKALATLAAEYKNHKDVCECFTCKWARINK